MITIDIAWGAVIGGIVGGIVVQIGWNYIRLHIRKCAIARAMAIELSYAHRELCECRASFSKIDNLFLLTKSPPRNLFDKVIAETPDLFGNDEQLMMSMYEYYGRIEDIVNLSISVQKKEYDNNDIMIYNNFLDWSIIQGEELLTKLELIGFGQVRTISERYIPKPANLSSGEKIALNLIDSVK